MNQTINFTPRTKKRKLFNGPSLKIPEKLDIKFYLSILDPIEEINIMKLMNHEIRNQLYKNLSRIGEIFNFEQKFQN